MNYIEYTPRRLSAILAAAALVFALQAPPSEAVNQHISKKQAGALTQAFAWAECNRIARALPKFYCKFMDLEWVQDRCSVHNPRMPYIFWLGSWATCPLRYWVKERGTGWQQLHGCKFGMWKRPPVYRIKGNCIKNTRFPRR